MSLSRTTSGIVHPPNWTTAKSGGGMTAITEPMVGT